jgi:hypothetical protein
MVIQLLNLSKNIKKASKHERFVLSFATLCYNINERSYKSRYLRIRRFHSILN